MSKYKLLLLGLAMDGIGILTSTWVLPVIGEFTDIIWAPLSAWAMTKFYKGNTGKIAGIITFIEEIVPGLDIIPSFTLMWFYTFVFKGSKASEIIDVDS